MIDPTTSTGILDTLGINGPRFLGQLFNFAIVMLVVWQWVYKPLLKAMDEREKKISGGLLNAEQAEKQLKEAEAEKAALLKEARQEAQALMEQARQDAKKERESLAKQTQEQTERQLAELKTQLIHERETAMKSLKSEVGGLVVEALGRVIPQLIDTKAQKTLVEEAIKNLKHTV